MKVSKNWLKEYLNLDNITDEELFNKITAHICEIESYEKLVNATNLTIGHVLECVEHPNSDHLHVCQVEIRPNEVKQIVCGAPNVATGKKVIVANVGAVLPGDFKIKPSKIRGVESNGMLCSLQELGIEEKYIEEEFKHGIYLLGEDAVVGENPLDYLGLNDTVIDLELTSNRSDLLSIEGVAYDFGAALNQKITVVEPELEESEKENDITVDIQTKDCYKYLARTIENVKIVESPQWLKARLIACGIRPINNVVDVTNYVLLELGQPLHAFDKDKLGNHIVIRNANPNETIVTLDEIERKLLPTDIVICGKNGAECLGGVMGGLTSEVENYTTNIALEAAVFDPLCIRKTSSRLGLKSESSTRFERKVDFYRVDRALDYAAQLIAELAGGTVLKGVSGYSHVEPETKVVDITTNKINSVLGTSLSDDEVQNIFVRLDYNFIKENDTYHITIPSRRMDLEASYQDIIEDVARINGYDNIPTTIASISSKGGLTYKQKRVRLTRQLFSSMGLNEVVSYSLVAKKDLYTYTTEEKTPVEVLMPMTEDKAVMRQSLLNGVLDALLHNKARKVENISFFEIGNTYSKEEEVLKLAGAFTGLYTNLQWANIKLPVDFYVVKGLLDAYFARMNVTVSYKPYDGNKNLHPGRTAAIYLNNKMIGIIGELHPRHAKSIDLNSAVVFEIELKDLVEKETKFEYEILNKFPTSSRDLALICDINLSCDDIVTLIKKTGKSALANIQIFDLYVGENIEADKKSLGITLTFENKERTLTSEEIDELINRILNKLKKELNVYLR